jgi:tripartite-type tricarboxylate transporter receptor subunit TctC
MDPRPRRRRIVAALAGAGGASLLFPLLMVSARAQQRLPDKDLHVLVGFTSGGGADIAVRRLATELQRRLGRHIHVENRPGKSGAVVGELLKGAPRDGSVVAFIPSTTLLARLTTKDFPFDPSHDLAPLSLAGTFSMGLAVSPRIGVATLGEYLQWAKQGDADHRRLGTTASDGFIDVLDSVLGKAMDIDFQPIPYVGATPLANDLEDGRLPAAVSAITSLLQHHRGHRLKLLLTSGTHRLRAAGDIPTARELGYPQLETREWVGFFAPAETPIPIVEAWSREIGFTLANNEIKQELFQLGFDVVSSSPEELRTAVTSHLAEWKRRLEAAGIAAAN